MLYQKCFRDGRTGAPPKDPRYLGPPIQAPPFPQPNPVPTKHPPIEMLSGIGCGCDDKGEAPIVQTSATFELDPIFKWGLLAIGLFLVLKK